MSDVRTNRDSLAPEERDRHLPGDVADTAAFVAHIGYAAHQLSRGATFWPFPLTADCNDLHRLAEQHGVLREVQPDAGALYLRYSSVEQRYVRASIVIAADHIPGAVGKEPAYDCIVIEGAARLVTLSHRIDPEYGRVPTRFETEVEWVRKTRLWAVPTFRDRFVSWVDLDRRNLFGAAVNGKAA